jgi:hypothetical protein
MNHPGTPGLAADRSLAMLASGRLSSLRGIKERLLTKMTVLTVLTVNAKWGSNVIFCGCDDQACDAG